LVIGVDGGTKNDMTAVNPTILLNNNMSILLDQYYHDPKKTIPLAPSQQSAYIYEFLQDLLNEYPEIRHVQKMFLFDSDSGSQELMLELRNNYNFSATTVKGKNVKDDNNLLRDILIRDLLLVVGKDNYKDYHSKKMEKGFPFRDEIMSYVYDNKTNDIKRDQKEHTLKSQIYVSKLLYSDNTFRYNLGLKPNIDTRFSYQNYNNNNYY
jgi:hypothetical protein